jgi:hypothetical protein
MNQNIQIFISIISRVGQGRGFARGLGKVGGLPGGNSENLKIQGRGKFLP